MGIKTGQAVLKRGLDLIIAVVAAVILFPLFIIIGFAIKVVSPGPIIYKQPRLGWNGKIFTIYKFRTMVVGAEKMGAGYGMIPNDPRLIPCGAFLRRLSLDELPQIFNVIKGDMSLVGPRPVLAYQFPMYTEEQKGRLRVRPGITGLAQVKGRNELPWSARIKLDNWYIDNYSIFLDLKIILTTVIVVLTGKGLRQDQAAEEVEDFGGNFKG